MFCVKGLGLAQDDLPSDDAALVSSESLYLEVGYRLNFNSGFTKEVQDHIGLESI